MLDSVKEWSSYLFTSSTMKRNNSDLDVIKTMGELAKLKEKLESSDTELKYMKINEKVLRRYIVAHKTAKDAYEKIVGTNTWRKEYGVANITSETPGVKKYMATRISLLIEEWDKENRPIVYVAVRNHTFRNRDVDDMTQYIVYMLETACNKCKEDEIDNLCLLFDLKGFTLSCMDYTMVKVLFDIMTDHYPERLGVCLVLNAPFIFSACWAIIRAWLDENTASKIKFIKGEEELSAYVDPSIVPENM